MDYIKKIVTVFNRFDFQMNRLMMMAASGGGSSSVGEEEKPMESSRKMMKPLSFSGEKPCTPILDTINVPIHMKNLSTQELGALANELREEIVHTVSKTGGHLSSSLGVAELTVALHHVFNTPQDKIIWDVGHQVCHGCTQVKSTFIATTSTLCTFNLMSN